MCCSELHAQLALGFVLQLAAALEMVQLLGILTRDQAMRACWHRTHPVTVLRY